MQHRRSPLTLLLAVAALSGCAHRVTNQPLERFDPEVGYRFDPVETGEDNTNSLFVCLTFSGGGTRAAALAYGALRKLAQTRIRWQDRETRLIDEVDLISAVSGGAFTAAYYRVFGERIFRDFDEKFLYRDLQSELTWKILNPWNWVRLCSWWFDRIDVAAELYHETIFDRKTFGDIPPGRPFVVINATNMTRGAQFSFTQDQFDLIGSDLSLYPVANAVAASSAVPIALSPVTLKNNPRARGYRLPRWIRRSLRNPAGNPQRYRRAKNLAIYHLDKKNRPYIHLIDGSVSDNLGLNVLLDELRQGYIQQLYHERRIDKDDVDRIEKLLLVVVNARTRLDESLDRSSTSPGMFAAAYNAANVSIDHHSFAMLEIVKEALQVERRAKEAVEEFQKLFDRYSPFPRRLPVFKKNQVYLAEINFDQIEDPRERNELLDIPTNLGLERDEVRRLVRVAGTLLDSNVEFQRFLRDLEKDPRAGELTSPGPDGGEPADAGK